MSAFFSEQKMGNAPVDAINAAGTLAGLDVRKIAAQIAKYFGKG